MMTGIANFRDRAPTFGMAYRIEYFLQGVQVGAVPYPKTLEEAKIAALIGLGTHNADLARILDMDHNGAVVGVVKR